MAAPYEVAELLDYAGPGPVADGDGPVNVYGVPWVIGAKQGLPNFNQLSLLSAAQVTRKLEITRSMDNPKSATYSTNQAYIIGVSNEVGITFWNSYSNAYPRLLTVVVSDNLHMVLTNNYYRWPFYLNDSPINFFTNVLVTSWAGSHWGEPPNATPQSASILPFSWAFTFQDPLVYNDSSHDFANGTFEPLSQLDQLGLVVTNDLQAYILDGSNVIDYVQLCSPTGSGGLNQALADPNSPGLGNVHYQWSTNVYNKNANITYGVINQLAVSENPSIASAAGGQWSTAPMPMGSTSPIAEAAYFDGFFVPTFDYNGLTYVNRQLAIQAPFTPSRTVYFSFLLQANDPLVHYLASDLDSQMSSLAVWANQINYNGKWTYSDDPLNQPLPVPPTSPVGGRYQPWGNVGQLAAMANTVDNQNPYNVSYKDPLVWSSDDWNFPTGQTWNLNWIGQVHRGTPWQTVYLKSTNILAWPQPTLNSYGVLTWAAWTADYQTTPSTAYTDAEHSAPIWDWQMVGLLAAMLNTNDLRTQLSVNNLDTNAWAIELDGMTVLSNTGVYLPGSPPQFTAITISSNSLQAAIIVNAIQSVRASLPGRTFENIGYVLATPQLSVGSPFLYTNNPLSHPGQSAYSLGITDQAYEAIPSQLLPLLRVDPVGTIVSTNGQLLVRFSGYDGNAYAPQASPDLVNWTSVSTNSPANGEVDFTVPGMGAAQFYRTMLVQP